MPFFIYVAAFIATCVACLHVCLAASTVERVSVCLAAVVRYCVWMRVRAQSHVPTAFGSTRQSMRTACWQIGLCIRLERNAVYLSGGMCKSMRTSVLRRRGPGRSSRATGSTR